MNTLLECRHDFVTRLEGTNDGVFGA